jgi:mycothiol synthase
MKLSDYRDERLGDLQACIAQWHKMDKEGVSYLCHVGDVPHRIYNGTRGRLPLAELVKIYEPEGAIQGFILGQPYGNGFDVFVNPSLSKDELKALLEEGYQITRHHMEPMRFVEGFSQK